MTAGVTLHGARVLVVGASAGIGAAFAVRAVAGGAAVVVAARRADRLEHTVAEAGGGHVVVADLRSEEDCRRMVADAVDVLGGLDLVMYSAGVAPLRSVADADDTDLAAVFETNVFGVQHVLRAAVPETAPGGIVAVLSSESVMRPWAGLGIYASSKSAVETLLRSWRFEHPEVRFSCVTVGATQPTEFGSEFDADALGPAYASWVRHGMVPAVFMDTGDLAQLMLDTFASALAHPGIGVEHLTLRSSSPAASPR